MTRHKPQPWYTAFNPPAWSPRNGRNRKPSPQAHSGPTHGTDYITGIDPGKNDASAITIAWGPIVTFYPTFEPPARPAIPHAGIRAGELTGHRMWLVMPNNQLCSIAHYFIWEPNATIEGKTDELIPGIFSIWAPNPIYGGIYSYLTAERTLKEVQQCIEKEHSFPTKCLLNFKMVTIHGIAWGTIKNWGEVVEHEHGYRAQYAKLTSIDGSVGDVDLDALRSKYNV